MKKIILLICLFFTCNLAFCQNDTIEHFFQTTEEAIRKGGFDDTEVSLYMNYLKNYPDSALAYGYYLRASISEKRGNHRDCIEDATKALLNGLRNPEQAYFLRGNCHYAVHELDSAIIDYSEAIKIDSGFYEAYYLRAVSNFSLRNYDKSLLDYTKIIELFPKVVGLYYLRGQVLYNLERYEEAFKDLQKTAQMDSGKAKDANALIERGKKMLNPITIQDYNLKSYDYLLDYKFEKALKTLNEAVEKNLYDDKTYSLRGFTYFHIAKYNEAIADYNKALSLKGNKSRLYYDRGEAKNLNGDKKGAIKDWRKARRLGDKDAEERLKEN